MKNESRNVILKCLNNVNRSCHQLFSGEGVKRGALSNNLTAFYGVRDAFWRLLTLWKFYQFDFGELTDATMKFFFFK